MILCCAVLVPQGAFAQSDTLTDAQQQQLLYLIDAGKRAYDAGDFESALGSFRQAHDLYRHPDLTYRIALCYERLGEDVQAVRFYQQFLMEAPTAPERPRVEKTIEVIEARIAKSELRVSTVPTRARVYINDIANGVAGETPTTLPVTPGTYTVIVQKDGYQQIEQLVTVASGKSLQLHYQLASLEQPEVMPRRPSPVTGPVVLLGVAAVATGITSVVLFGEHGKQAEKVAQIDRNATSRRVFNSERLKRDVLLGAGIGTATIAVGSVIGAYWIYSANRAKNLALSATWTEAGPYANVELRF